MPRVDYLTLIFAVYGTIIGAALASFACVLSDRIPRGEPFAGGRSHCVCQRQLRAWENIPVFGWARTWGRARCCGARIPAKYVLAEVGGAVAGGTFAAEISTWVANGAPWFVPVLAAVGCSLGLVWVIAALTWPHTKRGDSPEPASQERDATDPGMPA